jgi:hypothetical protein
MASPTSAQIQHEVGLRTRMFDHYFGDERLVGTDRRRPGHIDDFASHSHLHRVQRSSAFVSSDLPKDRVQIGGRLRGQDSADEVVDSWPLLLAILPLDPNRTSHDALSSSHDVTLAATPSIRRFSARVRDGPLTHGSASVENDCDVVSTTWKTSYPNGINVQVYGLDDLAEVAATIFDPPVREHVSLYFYEHPERYRAIHLFAPRRCHAPELRLSLDYPEDHQLICAVYERLLPRYGEDFGAEEIVRLLREEEPALAQINAHRVQRAPR